MPSLEKILFKSGDLFLPSPVRSFLEHYYIGSDTSLFYITNWTFIHFFTGVLLAYYFIQRMSSSKTIWTVFWIHTAWEIWQIIGKNTPIQTLRGVIDVFVDTFSTMLGAFLYLKYF